MPIKTLETKNFKSIKQMKLNCRRINLFIGAPNSGKSNILESLGLCSFLFHGRRNLKSFVRFENLRDLFYDHILDEPLTISFDGNNFEMKFENGQFFGFFAKADEEMKVMDHIFSAEYDGIFDFQIRADFAPFKFYRFANQNEFPNQRSEFLFPPNGDNLLAIIMSNKQNKRVVKNLFDKFGYRINLRPEEGKIDMVKELEDVLFSFPYSLSSETLQRMVFYLIAMHSNKNSIITFEEPEAHAFPYYTKYLAERVALDNHSNQYFIATHNPYFLMSILEKASKNEIAVFVTSLEKYQTKVTSLNEKKKQEILEMGSDVFFNIKTLLNQQDDELKSSNSFGQQD